MLHDLVARKIKKLEFRHILQKKLIRKIKRPDLALQKCKTHFSWDETKIALRGIPRYLKGHARVQYSLVSTNYAMIRVKPSSFDLKTMQPRTW
jgi:hypothetical protein